MKLILIRHGETEWNACRRVQGRSDIELNARGVLQAKTVARSLIGARVDAVYSSPLKRAIDTARQIAKAVRLTKIEPMEGLTEINFGAWEGRTNEQLQREFPAHWGDWNWVLDQTLCHEIGAESADEILARSLFALGEIQRQNSAEATVVLVSHTMPIKLITAHGIGLPLSRIRDIRTDNCASSILHWRANGEATLIRWNDTSYLEGLL